MARTRRTWGHTPCDSNCIWLLTDRGELLDVALTPGNVDDRKPVRDLLQEQNGRFFGDKGLARM